MPLYKVLKYKVIFSVFLLLGHLSMAQENEVVLKVVVTGFKEPIGAARVLIFDQAEGYPGKREKALDLTQAQVESEKVEVSFNNLEIGRRYAIAIYHDKNENKHFDSNFFGIPTEGYGTSNNINVLRSPTFEETSFILEKSGQTLNIKLLHIL